MEWAQPHLSNGWNFKWDLIHFNFGLHDLKYTINGEMSGKYDVDNGMQVIPPEHYRKNIHDICRYLQSEYPKATLVFATTTPVPAGSSGRVVGDAARYNQVASDVLAQYPKIGINDLYEFTFPNFDEWCVRPGNVHFNEQGRSAQGKEVARVISDALGL